MNRDKTISIRLNNGENIILEAHVDRSEYRNVSEYIRAAIKRFHKRDRWKFWKKNK